MAGSDDLRNLQRLVHDDYNTNSGVREKRQRRGMWEDRDLEQQFKDKLNELDADVELATYRRQ